MAGEIKGITIEIAADVTQFEKEIKGLNKSVRDAQKDLYKVNKLLKLDPKNTEMLRQKQELLSKSIEGVKKRLELEKQELEKLKSADQTPEVKARMEKLERQIVSDQASLEKLQKEFKDFGSVGIQQIKAVGQEMQEAGKKISDIGQKLAPVSAAAAAVGGSLMKLGYDAVTNADDLNTLAKQTGLTTDEIQKMKYASDLIDVSFDDIAGALRKMKGNLDGHPETWERLGVSVTNADGSMREVNDIFRDVIKALSKVENGTERDQLAMDIFGKSADSLAGVIDDGGASLDDFGKKAEEAGYILSQDTLDSLNETNDMIDELKANFSATAGAIGADVATAIAPALEIISEKAQAVTSALRELSPEQTAVILAIVGVVGVLSPVIIVIGQLITAIGAIATAAAPVIAAIGAFAAAFGGPVLAIGVAIGAFALFLKNYKKIEEKTNELVGKLAAGWENIKASVSGKVDALKAAVSQKWEALKASVSNTVETLKATVINKWEALKTGVNNKVESLKSTVSNKFNALKTAITKPIETAKNTIQNAMGKIKSAVNNCKLSLPRFKLPHFSVSGGVPPYGLGGMGVKPSFSVSWYKKAYQDPVIFTRPTVLPTVGGLKGFGDGSGAEIVMSLNKLQELMSAGQQGQMNTYITVNALPGMNVEQLADLVQQRFVQLQKQEARVYA